LSVVINTEPVISQQSLSGGETAVAAPEVASEISQAGALQVVRGGAGRCDQGLNALGANRRTWCPAGHESRRRRAPSWNCLGFSERWHFQAEPSGPLPPIVSTSGCRSMCGASMRCARRFTSPQRKT
jgi:hypothetical protein